MAAPSSSLSITVAHAIAYLSRPLSVSYSAATIGRLQLSLEANLVAHFAPSWVPSQPLRGSGRRCLTLSPATLPPRPIYNACTAANVKWAEWIAALGGAEMDLFVDPGCVSIRFANAQGTSAKLFTVWSDATTTDKAAAKKAAVDVQVRAQVEAQAMLPAKTFAQQLIEDSDETEELFARIDQEVRAPTWMTPVLERFSEVPIPSRLAIPTVPSHSRSSSSSSVSSSGFSFSSVSSASSASSIDWESDSTVSSSSSTKSRRERTHEVRVVVDKSKTEVTPYDGGKTTVLTGGVMLGAGASPRPTHRKTASSASASSWRSARA